MTYYCESVFCVVFDKLPIQQCLSGLTVEPSVVRAH